MSENPKNLVYIALGSNGSDQLNLSYEQIEHAIGEFANKYLKVLRISKYYQTPAFPKGNGPDFINAVISIETGTNPVDLLTILHSIESQMGRVRETRWGQRNIDIDIIDYNQNVHPDKATYQLWRGLPLEEQKIKTPDQLILPHPRVQDRAFVLIPLRDIAPDWRHPETGEEIGELIEGLPPQDVAEIKHYKKGS